MAPLAMATLIALGLGNIKDNNSAKERCPQGLGLSLAQVLHGEWGRVIFRRRNGEKGTQSGE